MSAVCFYHQGSLQAFGGLTEMQAVWGDTRTGLISAAILTGAIGLALVVHFALFFAVERIVQRKDTNTESLLTRRAKKSTRFIFPLLALVLALPFAPIP